MEVHGIDEAGYGPLLGPLVIARCDFRLDEEAGIRAARKDPEVLVEDSKKLLLRRDGRARLEEAVLGFHAARHGVFATNLAEWIEANTRPGTAAALAAYPWYRDLGRPLPLVAERASVARAADAWSAGRVFRGGSLSGLEVRVVEARELNQSVEATDNKHMSLFHEVLDLVEAALPGSRRHDFTIDKLGGRSYYAEKLTLSFPFMPLEVVLEDREESVYRLELPDAEVALRFLMKADDRRFEVAIASMCAKYTREALMTLFNDYWRTRAPGIRPTAGYYEDGRRFVAELEGLKALTDELRGLLVRRR